MSEGWLRVELTGVDHAGAVLDDLRARMLEIIGAPESPEAPTADEAVDG